MKIYTIAEANHVNEHGGGFTEQVIRRNGAYGSGDFPPCFLTELEAANHIVAMKMYGSKVVELELKS